jgi:phage baseplate assembly protein W
VLLYMAAFVPHLRYSTLSEACMGIPKYNNAKTTDPIPPTYKGIRWPFQAGAGGLPDQAYDDDLLRGNLERLLLLNPGDCIMRETGTGLLSELFEPSSPARDARIRAKIQNSISKFDPRIILLGVDLQVDEEGTGTTVTVSWQSRTTNKPTAASIFVEASNPALA